MNKMRNILRYNESQSSFKITIVDFTGGGDGVTALYLNGKRYKYGDHYHDKINDWIEGFKEGIRVAGEFIEVQELECKNPKLIEEISEMGSVPPKLLDDIEL